MSWTFFLRINNQTDRELTTDGKNYSLKNGIWYRDRKDNRKPTSVGPGKNKQALGIRAANGTWTGYECQCTWFDSTEGSGNLGSIELQINVPFSGDNSSTFEANGLYELDGWKKIPKSGNSWTKTVTVLQIGGELVAVEDNESEETKEVRISHDHYEMLLSQSTELIANWPDLENEVPEGAIDPDRSMPNEYLYPPPEFVLCRSKATPIPKELWAGLSDRTFQSLYSKTQLVDEYFHVRVSFMNTNPREWVVIPEGKKVTTFKSTTIESSIKTTLETSFSIKTSLETKSGDPLKGREIAAKIEAEYSQKNVLEESTSRIDTESVTVEIEPRDYTRTYVPWVFSNAVAIYRKTKKGNYGLVAVSEWADFQNYRTFRQDSH